jgi:DNA-binding NarL/FixJ family response regulator
MADDRRSARAIRVLVVEDYEPFRRVICTMLDRMPGLQIVGDVSDGIEAVRKAEELQPDLVLMDVGWPPLNGLMSVRRIRALSPASKIIVVTIESSSEVVEAALSLGAAGYVVKTRIARDLPAAVDAVLRGRQFISGGLSAQEFPTQVTITGM